MNYSSAPATLTYAYQPAHDLLTGHSLDKSQQLTITPWDLIIAKEN